MWNYIKGLLRLGIPFKVGALGFWLAILDAAAVRILINISNAATITARTEYVRVAILICPVAIFLTLWFILGVRETMSPVPYWGRLFGMDAVFKLLAEDKFSSYVTRDGYVCHDLKVSESGRWMKIAGRYYPIPLVKGLNVCEDHLELINGDSIEIRGMKSRATLLKAGLISLAKSIDYEITLEDNKADKDEEKDKEVSVCGTI